MLNYWDWTLHPDGIHCIPQGGYMSTQVSIRTNAELLGQFNAMAEATGRTRSYLINQAMEEYIAREAWQVAEIRKGLEEADAGEFVPDAEMQAFWDRWTK